jgi:hypothetical protein
MLRLSDYPLLVFAATFVVLLGSVWIGAGVLRRRWPPADVIRDDQSLVLAATLTLLGLIVGFTFSMAISRYDQRKNLEEEEANAIGTEFARAALLPAADAAQVRALLRDYFDQRILFYTTSDPQALKRIDARTAQLQGELWAAVVRPAAASPTPVVALAVSGMNDVLNSQGYTQAAWTNRIPRAAWTLMIAIAVCCNILVGYGARDIKREWVILGVLPLVTAISMSLVADIDAARAGLIRIVPQNLMSISSSLRAP